MIFDRKTFYDAVRPEPFPDQLSQQQVDGMDAILTRWEGQMDYVDIRYLAYMLATTFHETAQTMWPIEEYGKGSGYEYGIPDPETGQAYYGRGFVQLTWRDNYRKATDYLGLRESRDLEWHAEYALDLDIAGDILLYGMAEGWFTGKGLPDFFNETTDDAVGARIIINNDVSKMGKTIAGYHGSFLAALQASARDEEIPSPGAIVGGVDIVLTVTPGIDVSIVINGELVAIKAV